MIWETAAVGTARLARDKQIADAEDQEQYTGEATREPRSGGTSGRSYTQPPLFRGLKLGEARSPYAVSREPLRSFQDPRLRSGETERGQIASGGIPHTQSSVSRNPEDGATVSPYSAGGKLRPLPDAAEVTPGDRLPPYPPPPPFQGPKYGGAQPLSTYLIRRTSCDWACEKDGHHKHVSCNRECWASGHAPHLYRDRLWRESQNHISSASAQN